MKICERCGGEKVLGTHLCSGCHGTGVIPLGPEGQDRYRAKRRQALVDAVAHGRRWWVRATWVPVTQADIEAFDAWRERG